MRWNSFLIIGLLSWALNPVNGQELDLSGNWSVVLQDPAFVGQTYDIYLPGTTDAAGIGYPDTLKTALERTQLLHLTRKHSYVGKAVYTRRFTLGKEWSGKELDLTLERVLWTSRVWIDGRQMGGSCRSLVTPHIHRLPPLTPGEHTLSVEVDNSKQLDISSGDQGISYTNDTQVIWNGILGQISLKAVDGTRIERVEVYPDVQTMTAKALVFLEGNARGGRLTVRTSSGRSVSRRVGGGIDSVMVWLDMRDAPIWSEFSPQICSLNVEFRSGRVRDQKEVRFGMRQIRADDSRILVNDVPVFLRGTLECCVFPLTGTPPTDEAGWEKVFQAARQWGLNHLRFHSWCPPDAAFRVADRLGFYLSVELPVWVTNLGPNPAVKTFMEEEAEQILRHYGNHPSFCMLSNGNELQRDFVFLNALTARLKARDPRHLYTTTSYTFERGHGTQNEPEDQYFVTQRTRDGWVRGQGVFDVEVPAFNKNYDASMGCVSVPLVTHEIGQYAVYPDLKEIDRYTGTLIPHNFEAIRDDLSRKGLLDRAEDYLQASGQLGARLYKEEIERAMKTRGISGYQLLGLQDFPGQGTALVGLVNAFWESKGIVSPEWFKQFCSSVVLLADFDKAVWTSEEKLAFDIKIANYAPETLRGRILHWQLLRADGSEYAAGEIPVGEVPCGEVMRVGGVQINLQNVSKAEKLSFQLHIDDTEYRNAWDVWVYPSGLQPESGAVLLTDDLARALQALEQGRKVLLSPRQGTLKGLEGKYVPVFWSPIHFPRQAGTMGLICDPSHPAFRSFPTDFFADWQWWRLCKRSTVLAVDVLPGITPIVEAIDNFANNRRLATVFEARCGEGCLLFSSIDLLSDGAESPEIQQFLCSLLDYMNLADFSPSGRTDSADIRALFKE